MHLLPKTCRVVFLLTAFAALCLARDARAAAKAPEPPTRRVGSPTPEPDEKDQDEPDEEDAKKRRDKAKAKPRVTRIKDALTIDPDLYGVSLSESLLGEANDVVTKEALELSSRGVLEEGLAEEREQIVHDRRIAEYERAAEEEQEMAEAEAEAKEEAAVEVAEETSGDGLWLLLAGGALVVFAIALFAFAMRKIRAYE